MKTVTKIEKAGLEKVSKMAIKKLVLVLDRSSIDDKYLSSLESFWGTDSAACIVEKSISHVASSLAVARKNLIEQSKFDRLDLIKSIQKSQGACLPDLEVDRGFLKVTTVAWQLMIIASQSEEEIISKEKLVNFCLFEVFKFKKVLFGEI